MGDWAMPLPANKESTESGITLEELSALMDIQSERERLLHIIVANMIHGYLNTQGRKETDEYVTRTLLWAKQFGIYRGDTTGRCDVLRDAWIRKVKSGQHQYCKPLPTHKDE